MSTGNIDIRIKSYEPLITPAQLNKKFPLTKELEAKIRESRATVNAILKGEDKRLLAIVGPCSIHDPKAAREYASKLKVLSDSLQDEIFIVMRTYFEKPRTVGGWKGLIVDPDMDHSYKIGKGLEVARHLLLEITEIGLPVGCEVLDPVVPQYIDELMSWSAIGARTTESQTHRNIASGLSVAVGFKNSTNGCVTNAINAIKSCNIPAAFIGIDRNGSDVVIRTTGNDLGHLILRGGDRGPNYYEDEVELAKQRMVEAGLQPRIIIDCSHANSRKRFSLQSRVLRAVIDEVCWGEHAIRGFMLESNLYEGSQCLDDDVKLKYGVSVTDGCIGFDETQRILTGACQLLRRAKYDETLSRPL
ncbi:MAG: 3-deoxy-7-phosphoheptulonate synthase [Spirochaetia bacterium]|jgi:3-deoxy-7-phosphoheptulonate synthase|nr:3-deoxy-7-phosphoheptulonate synthase [Spirochaetia bacterium]